MILSEIGNALERRSKYHPKTKMRKCRNDMLGQVTFKEKITPAGKVGQLFVGGWVRK